MFGMTKQGSIDTASPEFRDLLFTYSSQEATLFILQQGVPVDLKKKGMQPIHFAVQKSDIPKLRLLLKHGADINAKDDAGRTLLHHAAEKATDTSAMFEELLELGADFAAVDEV